MLIILSPSKTVDFSQSFRNFPITHPEFTKEATRLVKVLRKFSVDELIELMRISPKLAQLNQERFYLWNSEPDIDNSRQSIFAFKGEVYSGFDASTLSLERLELAQKTLRILSGLYGLLRPFDLIHPYRLEMGIPLKIGQVNNLYEYWGTLMTKKIQIDLDQSGSDLLIDLASDEYSKVLNHKRLKAQIIKPEFKEEKDGAFKMVSFYVKRARGLMSRFIIENNIQSAEDLRAFDAEGYLFNDKLSRPGRPLFTRLWCCFADKNDTGIDYRL